MLHCMSPVALVQAPITPDWNKIGLKKMFRCKFCIGKFVNGKPSYCNIFHWKLVANFALENLLVENFLIATFFIGNSRQLRYNSPALIESGMSQDHGVYV